MSDSPEYKQEYKDVENKLLILYLISRMELSMSRAQITEFVMDKKPMNYFDLEPTLSDMLEQGLLESFHENAQDVNTTRYIVTNEGGTCLEYFENHIPRPMRNLINQYIDENRGKIKRDFESTANYFPIAESDEFHVKCGVYDDKRVLLELTISVETREQAKHIQGRWRSGASAMYSQIVEILTVEKTE